MSLTEIKPLVSCTVISYNSAATIIETLDSIKNQTYDNIELIISDDCSKDNTVDICRIWIEQNKSRFVRVELITVEKNTGVCGNDNRALEACQGEWQKGIAADDILLPNCVSDFVSFANEHKEMNWASSYTRIYKNDFSPKNCIARSAVSRRSFFDLQSDQQLKQMAVENLISAPSCFYRVSLKREVGGYDTRYSYEDYPMFITLLEKGEKCFFMDKETVGYRVHDSFSHSTNKLFNYQFLREDFLFKQERCFRYLSKWQVFGQRIIWAFHKTLEKTHLNKDTKGMRIIYRTIRSLFRLLFFKNR